jgi:predicted ATPase/class 3 adenylate cyclase
MTEAGTLPSGTVTLLFSDIEGSTRLVQRLGSDWVTALGDQRRMLRQVWSRHGGVELGTEGDSFFVAFAGAAEGVRAAVDGQRALLAHEWPRHEQVRVRMGLHTGAPLRHEEGYVGLDVHRAARIAGAAHGGQVLVSRQTEAAAGAALPDLVYADLGDHRLKDLPDPERIFQVGAEHLPVDFPPLKTLGSVYTLPQGATELLGREHDLEELVGALTTVEPRPRLLTLTGPGGVGKTRLAVEVAQAAASWHPPDDPGLAFPDGVFFAPLAEAFTLEALWQRLTQAVGLPPATTRAALLGQLGSQRSLLVLDNLEQLPDAHLALDELVRTAPLLTLLVTSRRPVMLAGEREHPLEPLAVPLDETLEEVRACGAVQLFADRARRVRPDFTITPDNAAAVTEICRALDGLPLALELAAARTRVLAPKAIAARLGDRLDLVTATAGVPPRQRSLRATLDWSYDLLDPGHQRIFSLLGVFSGATDLTAIEAVLGSEPDFESQDQVLETMVGLVAVSLVRVREGEDGEPRFGLLQTVRDYAVERLETHGELAAARSSHAAYFATRAEALGRHLQGPELVALLEQLDQSMDNLRGALDWASATEAAGDQNRVNLGLRILHGVDRYWALRGLFTEEGEWVRRFELVAEGDSVEHAELLVKTAQFLLSAGRNQEARPVIDRCLEMGQRVNSDRVLAEAYDFLFAIEGEEGNLDAAAHAAALARGHAAAGGVLDIEADLEGGLLHLAIRAGDFDKALEHAVRRRELLEPRRCPIDPLEYQHGMAWVLRRAGRSPEALPWIQKAVRSAMTVGFPYGNGLPYLAEDYAGILADLGDATGAACLLGSADARRERNGNLRPPDTETDIELSLSKARRALSADEWRLHHERGHEMPLEDALTAVEQAAG